MRWTMSLSQPWSVSRMRTSAKPWLPSSSPAVAPPSAATAIVDALKSRIANYKVPKRVFVVDDLPRNAMGKVQKNVLRERYKRIVQGAIRAGCGEVKPNGGRGIGTLFEPRGGIARTASINPVLPLV